MIRLGLTGGIGSGKSYVADLLRRRRIPVFDTDTEAKRLMMESGELRRALAELLGEGVFLPDGRLNKPLLSAYVFSSACHAERINNIVHPAVRNAFRQWAVEREVPLVAVESAILYESGFDALVDKVLLVSAPRAVCLERVMRRNGMTEGQVQARMSLQMPDEKLREKVDYVIENDGVSDVEAALDGILAQLVGT